MPVAGVRRTGQVIKTTRSANVVVTGWGTLATFHLIEMIGITGPSPAPGSGLTGNGSDAEFGRIASIGEGSRLDEVERPHGLAVVIVEGKLPPPRRHPRRQRIVSHRLAAKHRRDGADIRVVGDLDPEQMQALPVLVFADKRDAGEAKKAGRVRRCAESGDEALLDKVDILPGRLDGRRTFGKVRNLPLCGLLRAVMADSAMTAGRTVMVVVVMVVVVIMCMVVRTMMMPRMISAHGHRLRT